ncbi:MAG: EamA family transporter [Litoreibacter sp.]|uniref:EamA family transporter n=1 Tax=Litoreibacter sp. TaxID=1969459 RepID=UPI0032997ACD
MEAACLNSNFHGLAYLGFIGAALTYVIWLNGIAKIQPTSISLLGLLSPLSVTFLGWVFLTERLSVIQAFGAVLVLSSVFFGQYVSQLRRS